MLQEHGEVQLSALGIAMSSMVTVAEILKSRNLAVEKRVLTSLEQLSDGMRPRQKPKVRLRTRTRTRPCKPYKRALFRRRGCSAPACALAATDLAATPHARAAVKK
jgi:hypothetical protein